MRNTETFILSYIVKNYKIHEAFVPIIKKNNKEIGLVLVELFNRVLVRLSMTNG